MNARSLARAAAVPLEQLNLASRSGRREFLRRMRWEAQLMPNAWEQRTGAPMSKPKCLKGNEIGWKQRRRWVSKGNL